MQKDKEEIIEDLAGFSHDPLGWVMYSFEWGKGELEKFPNGPEPWQRDQLERISSELKANAKSASQVIQEAVASGHGIGKSADVAWLIMWGLHTFEDTKIVVTANTETQLKTKTWSELAKWHRLCWFSQLFFEYTATAYYSLDKAHEKTWRADMIPWSINNTEAFAGLHNQGKRIIVIFDEASAIPDTIFEVTEGALTDEYTEILWLIYGNPTMNTGRFIECFGRYKHRWNHNRVDSRKVSLTNKAKLQQWIDDYGEDSDFVRVRVKGIAPRTSATQFISSEVVEKCIMYKCEDYADFPKIMGVDLARFGDDQSVILIRQGRKVYANIRKWRNMDGMYSAGRVVEAIDEERPDAVFIDGDGLGGPILDRVKQLVDERIIIEVNNGLPADKAEIYFNKRAEMWGLTKEALIAGLDIPNDEDLEADLSGPQYGFDPKNRIQIESKKDMKSRGLSSPDCADSLIMTYSKPVLKKPKKETQFLGMGGGDQYSWMG